MISTRRSTLRSTSCYRLRLSTLYLAKIPWKYNTLASGFPCESARTYRSIFDELFASGSRRRLVHVLVVERGWNGRYSTSRDLSLDGFLDSFCIFRDLDGLFRVFEHRRGVDFLFCERRRSVVVSKEER